jgi:hypothetical protein
MGRLIEVGHVVDLPAALVVQVGDLLLFRATGGRVQSGSGVTNLGSFVASTLAADGQVLSAVGAPDATLFHASEPGRALIELFTGDPWHEPRRTILAVEVRTAASATPNVPYIPK